MSIGDFVNIVADESTVGNWSGELIETLGKIDKQDWLENITQRVIFHVREVLGIDEGIHIDGFQSLQELGLESMMAVQLRDRFQDDINKPLPVTLLFDLSCIKELVEYIYELSEELVIAKNTNEECSTNNAQTQSSEEAKNIQSSEIKINCEEKDIAIIGMSCKFPGKSNSSNEFWQLLSNGLDGISLLDNHRWPIKAFYDQDRLAPGKMTTLWAGLLSNAEDFDAKFFGIPPREAISMAPQQRILLETCWETIESAGYSVDRLKGSNGGVYIGVVSTGAVITPEKILEIDMFHGAGNSASICTGRLSYMLDWHGPNLAIDTACSSSLVALHTAIRAIRAGDCSIALAGGVNMVFDPGANISLSKAGVMAGDGRCKVFDKSADGYVRSEGCGLVLVKKLSEAVRDRDNILAVLRGSAINQDGRSQGITAPNVAAQVGVMEGALADAGVSPEDIQYVEAHGTGTALGDPIEVNGINKVYGSKHSSKNPLYMGSVKSNIGHTEGAAGIAGLSKVVLSLQHNKIPPNLHLETISPLLNIGTNSSSDNIRIPTSTIDWPDNGNNKRIAAISSFGFSGTNAHIIVEEFIGYEHERKENDRDFHVLFISAKSEKSLNKLVKKYINYFENNAKDDIENICYTSNIGRNHFEHKIAVVCNSKSDASEKLNDYISGSKNKYVYLGNNSKTKYKIEFTYKDNLALQDITATCKRIYNTSYIFKCAIDECEEASQLFTNVPLKEVIWGESSHYINTQPYSSLVRFAIQYAISKYLVGIGVEPTTVLAEGYGEFAGACISKIFSIDDAISLIIGISKIGSGNNAITSTAKKIKYAKSIYPYNIEKNQISNVSTEEYWIEHCSKISTKTNFQSEQSKEFSVDKININSILSSEIDGNASIWEFIGKIVARGYVENINYDFDIDFNRRRVQLPTYVFEGKVFPIKYEGGLLAAAMTENMTNFSSSLLGNKIDIAEKNRNVFESIIRLIPGEYLADHKIGSEVILPAAAYVDVMLSASKRLFGSTKRIGKISFIKPCVVIGATKIQTVIFSEDGLTKCQIWTKNTGGEWVLNATGAIEFEQYNKDEYQRKNIIREEIEIVETENFYKVCSEHGYSYGESFQCLENVGIGWNQQYKYAVGKIGKVSNSIVDTEFHPTMLDAAFQIFSIVAGKMNLNSSVQLLPAKIESVQVFAPIPDRMEVVCYVQNATDKSIASVTCGFEFYSLDGEFIAAIENLTLKSKSIAENNFEFDTSKYLFKPVWKSLELVANGLYGGDYKIISDASCNIFADVLSKKLGNCEVIYANEDIKIENIISIDENSRSISIVFIGGSFSQAYNSIEENDIFDLCTRKITHNLFNILKTIEANRELRKKVRLNVLTRRTQLSTERKPSSPWDASLIGLSCVFAKEVKEVPVSVVDFNEEEVDTVIELLMQNSPINAGEITVIEDGVALKREFIPLHTDENFADNIKLAKHGTYLLVGGLGGIGKILAEYLVRNYSANLIFIGRNVDENKIDFMNSLEKHGSEIKFIQADITSENQVNRVFAENKDTLSQVNGIFNLAMLLDDKSIHNMDWDSFQSGAASKIDGTHYLVKNIEKYNPEFVIFFSSAQAIFFYPGQCNYAAGCAFQDAYARSIQNSPKLRVKVINWGYWGTVGAVSSDDYNARMKLIGAHSILPDEGMALMERALSSSSIQVLAIKAEDNILNKMTTNKHAAIEENVKEIRKPSDDSRDTKTSKIREVIQEKIITGLMLELSDLPNNFEQYSLGELGVDSLIVLDIRDGIHSEFAVDLTAEQMISAENINEIISQIYRELLLVKISVESDLKNESLEEVII